MAFIYRIVNKVNGKSYIGKTEGTVEKRFKHHLADYKKEHFKDRPLYRALLKYGIENFGVETIEETENAVEREIYWIAFYDTFGKGYNATRGGDGKPYIDEEFVLNALFENDLNCHKTAKKICVDHGTVIKIAKKYGFYVKTVMYGPANHRTILTEEDVQNIRKLYVPKVFGKRRIAQTLGLPLAAVGNVIMKKSWIL